MATSTRLQLTRDQLASFLQDHEQIRQFERLFALADSLQPTTLNDIAIAAGNADQKAVEALSLIAQVEQEASVNSSAANQKAVEALDAVATLAQDAAIQSTTVDQKAVQALDALNRIANALELLATAPVIRNDNSVVTDYIDFNVGAPDSAVNVGRIHWNGGYTLNLDMTPNVSQSVGESQYYYIKASATITKGQLIMFDGAVGASGVLKGKPATGVTNGQLIMGVAAESIANNDFGLVSSFGLVRGFNTSGAPYGETWADGDILYYNPSFAGGLTKTQPLAPIPHIVVAAVVNAATGGSGSVFVRVQAEPLVSQLSDVYVTSLAGNDTLVYDSTDQRWENKPVRNIYNIAALSANSVLYLDAGKVVTGNGNIVFDGTEFAVNSVGIRSGSSTFGGYFESLGGATGAKIKITPNASAASNGVIYNTGFVTGSAGPHIFQIDGTEVIRFKTSGQTRFFPLSTAPSGAEAGDVYYDSGTNKLRCYDGTAWNDLF